MHNVRVTYKETFEAIKKLSYQNIESSIAQYALDSIHSTNIGDLVENGEHIDSNLIYFLKENRYTIYHKIAKIIDEKTMQSRFKNAYEYLKIRKGELDTRDKGKKNSVAWYAYGRTQGLNRYGKKLLFSTFGAKPHFILVEDRDALFCNGYAIFENHSSIPPLNAREKEFLLSSSSEEINTFLINKYDLEF